MTLPTGSKNISFSQDSAQNSSKTGSLPTLYVVATPIGNMEDITLRALRILKEVPVIAAEDTREIRKILERHNLIAVNNSNGDSNSNARNNTGVSEIKKHIIAYHARNARTAMQEVVQILNNGNDCALVTDAGTPGISDPGNELVKYVQDSLGLNVGVKIVAVPGPSALTSALSIAGVDTHPFTFFGFAPNKKGRQTFFETVWTTPHTVVFYESSHRIVKALESLNELYKKESAVIKNEGDKLNANGRTVVVVREITKIYEEVIKGSASDVLKYFKEKPEAERGEFVVIVA